MLIVHSSLVAAGPLPNATSERRVGGDLRLEGCPGCGALFPPTGGPTHKYIGAGAGCWALFTPLSAGAQPDPELVARSRIPPVLGPVAPPTKPGTLGALLADAYATQHHGGSNAQAVQSVAVHLLALHGVLREGQPAEQALWIRRRASRTKGVFSKLRPPPLGTALTIRHLFPGGGVAEPYSVDDYARSVYETWYAEHSAVVTEWYARYVIGD